MEATTGKIGTMMILACAIWQIGLPRVNAKGHFHVNLWFQNWAFQRVLQLH
jgi:hypothetical protein